LSKKFHAKGKVILTFHFVVAPRALRKTATESQNCSIKKLISKIQNYLEEWPRAPQS
jgi:hypothetical protein